MPRAAMASAMRMAAARFCALSKFPYENAIQDVTHHLEVREREFAVLDIPAEPATPPPRMHRQLSLRTRRSKSWRTDFFRSPARRLTQPASYILSITISSASMAGRRLKASPIERDNPLDPVNLAFDKSGQPACCLFQRTGRHRLLVPPRFAGRGNHGANAATGITAFRGVVHFARQLSGTTANSRISSIWRR